MPGQTAKFIHELFIETDLSDFVGLSTAYFLRVSTSRCSWMSGAFMRPISPITGVISGLPAGIIWTGATPQAMAQQCTSAGPAVPIREAKRGGAPVLLKMP